MAILVYLENWDGKFKKLSFELLSYASGIARMTGETITALSLGDVPESELLLAGNFGASRILNISQGVPASLDAQVYANIIASAARKENATTLIFASNNTGKAVAPRVAVRLNAGLVTGITGLPLSTSPFVVPRKVFTGKSFAQIGIQSEIKVLTLMQNSFGVSENPVQATIENLAPEIPAPKTRVTETNKQTGKVLLTDADIVVSGGRGMKGPEFWAPIEELASLLGGATACSRPVADEGWRPHHEHVGQTGKIIAPTLYFAFGISGAIQHLGGVSSSKVIVAVNKDKDAPIFEAAHYGILGDVNIVLPQLIAAIREIKAQ